MEHFWRAARTIYTVAWLAAVLSGTTGCAHALGVTEGRLAPCPSAPHCVCSQATDKRYFIEPLVYGATPVASKTRVKAAMEAMTRTRLVLETENYLHYEVTTRIMRYVDDVEFYFDDTAKQVHVRSSSRIGYYDFGVNRRRVEALRRAVRASADTGAIK